MITLFTGTPGAGKTAAMVHLLSSLSGNRPVYVHFDPGSKRDAEQTLLHESLTLPHHPCNGNEWHNELPHGAILVIDEVQDIWRPRPSGSKVPPAVAALETHRHTGIDVFLTTQSPRLLDANVRQLVGRHVHIRDTGFLGRYWYEWPECNDSMQWKTCVNKKKFKLPKKAFGLYKSSSLHTPAVKGVPKSVYVFSACVVLLIGFAYYFYQMITRHTQKATAPARVELMGSSQQGQNPQAVVYRSGPIDDRVDWIPRVSNRPESAPAYDHLRVVVAMPVVRVGYCIADLCKCLTQQGTDAGLSSGECKRFVDNPPFDPYRAPVDLAAVSDSPAGKRVSKPPAEPPAATPNGAPLL